MFEKINSVNKINLFPIFLISSILLVFLSITKLKIYLHFLLELNLLQLYQA